MAVEEIDTAATAALVEDLLWHRRSVLRHCHYCRELKAPEERLDDRACCLWCAERWEGVGRDDFQEQVDLF